mgnify:CR=1 FL=1
MLHSGLSLDYVWFPRFAWEPEKSRFEIGYRLLQIGSHSLEIFSRVAGGTDLFLITLSQMGNRLDVADYGRSGLLL